MQHDPIEDLVREMQDAGEPDDRIQAVLAQIQAPPLSRRDRLLQGVEASQAERTKPGTLGDWLTLGTLVAGGPMARLGGQAVQGAIRTLGGTRLGSAIATGGGEALAKVPVVGSGLRAGFRAYQASRPMSAAVAKTPFSPEVQRLILNPGEAAREAHVDQLAKQLASRTGTLNASGAREALLRMLAGGE